MKVEKEFVGFVLPFAAGIFLATGPALIRSPYHPVLGTLFLAVTALALIAVMHPRRQHFPAWWGWAMMVILGLSAGAFMGVTSARIAISSYESSFSIWAAGYGHRLGEFIDGIAFHAPSTNALLKALITGERNDIPRAVTNSFRESGASHILSLSGFHLGIVYIIIKWSLSGLGNGIAVSRIRSVLIILFCGFYTLATGAGPSITRAFLFILLGETARLLHRQRSTATLLFSALLLQLVFSPASIRSVSFQLSYAAMAGIAYIYPWLRDFWPGLASEDRLIIRFARWIWNSASMSLACQLTTAPLVLIYFNSFPTNFLLTNLIALPLTSLLISLGLTVLVLSGLGICPQFLLHATDILTTTLTDSLEIIAGM